MAIKEYSKLKVAELREELSKRGIKATGTKSEMIATLRLNNESKISSCISGPENPSTNINTVESNNTKDDLPQLQIETDEKPINNESDNSEVALTEPLPSFNATVDLIVDETEPQKSILEDKTKEVLAELKKRLERSRRFEKNNTEEIEKSIARIEKFGLVSTHHANVILGIKGPKRNHTHRGSHPQRRNFQRNSGRVHKNYNSKTE
ncbi:uncharacterized protein SAPINGB_P003857 [Magnusiomyces paraingens]|uniref:SAP domain-containing protein n=1 Tax=Magnusiomyces paraingens TaxID=2606893 RepID=A0A5E8BSJ8_9ASCO|nr:uncharacterized protein SAPINGB_P003857 [Saprochaete ingens]VVT54001.1 unnamed protein product [Saprochaete ingens]